MDQGVSAGVETGGSDERQNESSIRRFIPSVVIVPTEARTTAPPREKETKASTGLPWLGHDSCGRQQSPLIPTLLASVSSVGKRKGDRRDVLDSWDSVSYIYARARVVIGDT